MMNEAAAGISKVSGPTSSSTSGRSGKECPLCGGLGYVARDLPTDHADFGKLFPCSCKLAEIERRRMEHLRALSNLDHLARLTFENFVPEGYGLAPDQAANLSGAYELARHYAENPQGWLVLFGRYGCGKTHLAAAIANRAIERGQPVLFIVVPDLLDYLRATFGPNSTASYDERFDQIRNAPLLILDDLGTQSSTSWAQEKLYQILNHRYNARLPTVITSNQRLDEIDSRVRSRMVDTEVSTVLTILAPDFRQSPMDRDRSDLSSLSLLGDMTFDSFGLREDELDPEQRENLRRVLETCREFAEEPVDWLVLQGDYGCGKTHLAAAIANRRVAAGHPALFVVVPELLDHLRATFSPSSQARFDQRFEEVRTAPLLVLDDLGTESASPWAREKLYQLFNYRYVARLPTIITMTQKPEEVDPRLRTRMTDVGRCRFWAILAPSYRGSAQRRQERKSYPRSGRSRK